ncbi:helix-turn-helix domain-containing protein [Streptomyces sp. NPDC051364]|uniref:helix-turn-helix transcriptional regulator n=1 Tax=unclassified Streptomyces TaxID=2593676 RepID=UPI003428DB5B
MFVRDCAWRWGYGERGCARPARPCSPCRENSMSIPTPTHSLHSALAASASAGAVDASFLNVRAAAAYLGLSPHTLYVWRHRRHGPPSFRMGPRGRVMYRRQSLDAWINEQECADSRSNPALDPLNSQPQRRAGSRA